MKSQWGMNICLTQFDVGSTEFCSRENQLWDQTKGGFFALYPLHHLPIHWFVMHMASLLCCPKIQSLTRRDYLLVISATHTINNMKQSNIY